MNYKRLFYNWLQKENIYNQFFSNVMTYSYLIHKYNSGQKVFEYIAKILKRDPRMYISAFVWDDTAQGYHFWSTKSLKWNEYLSKWSQTH